MLIALLFEGLSRCTPNGSIEPALAQKIELSEDKRVYTFHLRPSVWSNGKEVTADDFERSWKHLLHPSSPSPSAYLLYPILNAKACFLQEKPIEALGVRAVDTLTLRVELERPTPYFPLLTAFPLLFPSPEGDQDIPSCFNGPFLLSQFHPLSEILLQKNPSFWNTDSIHFDQIQILILPDERTALQLFQKGQIDWLSSPLSPLPLDGIEKLDSILFLPMNASTFCSFNTEQFPFYNTDLRKAFSLAINRRQITEQVIHPGQIPAERILPPSMFPTKALPALIEEDVLQAQIHLRKGLEQLQISSKDLDAITLFYRAGGEEKRLALALQKQWKEALGISVHIEQKEHKTYTDLLRERKYQIALGCWIAQFEDPINLLDRFEHRQIVKNYPGWEDKAYQNLLERAEEQVDPEKREQMLLLAEELLCNALPLTPIYHWRNAALCGPRIEPIPTTPSGGLLFEQGKPKEN